MELFIIGVIVALSIIMAFRLDYLIWYSGLGIWAFITPLNNVFRR